MEAILVQIREELESLGDENTRASSQRFFKEHVQSYGVRNPVVNKLGKRYFKQVKTRSKAGVFKLCESLWKSGAMEESLIACHWSYAVRKQFEPADFQLFGKWIDQYVTNWASCDTFCNHSVGTLIEMYPENLEKLKAFTASGNRWMRRASAVTLIVPARRGKFLDDILEIASLLLRDGDDMVQKGYGWMLKAASEAHQRPVFDFVMKNRDLMPRTAFRYAIEKMPAELKARAMKK